MDGFSLGYLGAGWLCEDCILHGSQPHDYYDLSPSGSEGSFPPLPLQLPVILWPRGAVRLPHKQEMPSSIPGWGSYLRQVSLH